MIKLMRLISLMVRTMMNSINKNCWLAIAEELSMDWQVDTWVIVQYDEQWYPGIIQEVRHQNAHSQSTKLLMFFS